MICSNVVGINIPHEYYSEGRPTEENMHML